MLNVIELVVVPCYKTIHFKSGLSWSSAACKNHLTKKWPSLCPEFLADDCLVNHIWYFWGYTLITVRFWMPWADSLSISNSRLVSQLQPCQMFISPIRNIFYFIRGIPAYVSRLYASDFLIKFLVFYRTWHLPCQHSANIFLALSRLSQVWKQQASLILFQWVCSLFITTCKHNVRIFCIWKQYLQ